MTASDLSVVIPTLGRELLRGCLGALGSAEIRPMRVIVVDQGRVEALARMAAEFRATGLDVQYVPSTRRGRSAGLNDGLREVRTAFVAITDDDCIPASNWVALATERLRRDPGTILTGRVEAGEAGVQLSVATSLRSELQRRPRLTFDRLSGGNMAIATDLARRIGPFDEDASLSTAEDAEYAYRALRAGVPIRYVPELVVTHLAWRHDEERTAQYRSYARSHGGFYGKYLRSGDAFIALRAACHWLRSLRRWGMAVLRGDADRAAFGRAYALGLFPGILAGWRRR
ncbi:MAG TPA: glycosyltransferase [Steroidobacteraceae bacterium]|nr:glycosyltransferase [Steroidobacteraceae bacterium]